MSKSAVKLSIDLSFVSNQLPAQENYPFFWKVRIQNLSIIDCLSQGFFLSDLN